MFHYSCHLVQTCGCCTGFSIFLTRNTSHGVGNVPLYWEHMLDRRLKIGTEVQENSGELHVPD